jgi:hypothetical protein
MNRQFSKQNIQEFFSAFDNSVAKIGDIAVPKSSLYRMARQFESDGLIRWGKGGKLKLLPAGRKFAVVNGYIAVSEPVTELVTSNQAVIPQPRPVGNLPRFRLPRLHEIISFLEYVGMFMLFLLGIAVFSYVMGYYGIL